MCDQSNPSRSIRGLSTGIIQALGPGMSGLNKSKTDNRQAAKVMPPATAFSFTLIPGAPDDKPK